MSSASSSSANLTTSQLLRNRIIQQIQTNGSLGFDQFLDSALYDPEYGYYCHAREKFGVQGDFITAPTRSSLYSLTIAKQCLQILQQVDEGCIVEFGPGNGELSKDVLIYLQHHDSLPKHYYLIEKSPALKQSQQTFFEKAIPELLPLIHWVCLEDIPDFSGVVIANELFDALLFKRIQVLNEQFQEMRITYDGVNFIWEHSILSGEIQSYIERNIPKQLLEYNHYQTEVHLNYEPLLHLLFEKIIQGVFLIMDYGCVKKDYYSFDKHNGSMRCFYQHRLHDDPFINIGSQDITCDVEFSALAYMAFENNYEILGYTTQANFLLGNDIQQIYNDKINDSNIDRIRLNSELKSLVMPDEMGERFKILALGKNYDQALDGFSFKDLRYTL